MYVLLALLQEHEAAEGALPATFRLEPGLMIWTWVVFVSLFLLLRKYAFPPIVRLTEARERKIASQLEQAEKANAEAQAILAEHRQLMDGAKEEAHALIPALALQAIASWVSEDST